jgi:hypothetical protein
LSADAAGAAAGAAGAAFLLGRSVAYAPVAKAIAAAVISSFFIIYSLVRMKG